MAIIKKIIFIVALVSIIFSVINTQNYYAYNNLLYGYIINELEIDELEIEELEINELEVNELIINEIQIFEKTINKSAIVKDIDFKLTSIRDFEDNFDNCFSSDTLMYDIDWAGVIGKFSAGTAIIVCTGVISFASASLGQPQLAFVFATSSKEAIKEALIGAAIGGTLNTIIETIKLMEKR